MTQPDDIRGGKNIAMKVPAHQFDAVVESYRSLGLPVIRETDDWVTFQYGPVDLHIDKVIHITQAELWLEFVAADLDVAAEKLAQCRFVRCDEIENLEGHRGFWVSSPASIVHLVTDRE